jgi:hypothetical protein
MTDNTNHSSYSHPASGQIQGSRFKRGLTMIFFLILFGIAETLLALGAIIQFFWMVFTGRRNELIADVGRDLGVWMKDVADFQTGNSDIKPFPWDKSNQI